MDHPLLLISILGLVIVLFSMLQSKKEKSKHSQHGLLDEMKDTFEQFSVDIEADNERLVQHIEQFKRQSDEQIRAVQSKLNQLEEQYKELQGHYLKLLESRSSVLEEHSMPKQQSASSSTDPATVPEDSPFAITERYEALLKMYEQGKSIEYISKSLGMNKGEVQLIITLARQEEKGRA